MSTRNAASTLSQIAKDLSSEWQETRSAWRDAKAAEFERTFLDPLPPLIARAVESMDDLDKCLRKLRSDCE